METGLAIVMAMVFMFGMLFSLMTLDEILGNLVMTIREKEIYKFPVGYAVIAMVSWTIFYFLNIMTP
jgi:hypothetical protein